MDRTLLHDAVRQLETANSIGESILTSASFALSQAKSQYSALLGVAKDLYPNRVDIHALKEYSEGSVIPKAEFTDAVRRLRIALDLRPVGSSSEVFAQIQLPPGTPADLALDMRELEGALSLGLTKISLMLAGSIAEALLLTRHPDTTERGPGLKQLVDQAKQQRLFGRDTLRHLETLVEYRDLIHPRAETRNQTFRNEARVDAAVVSLKLLCSELEDTTVRYQ